MLREKQNGDSRFERRRGLSAAFECTNGESPRTGNARNIKKIVLVAIAVR